MAEPIKPCPFCGSKNIEICGRGFVTLCCNDCGAKGPTDHDIEGDYDSMDVLTQVWNTRVATDG